MNGPYRINSANVAVIERSRDKVLIVRRGATAPWEPLSWEFPGGTVERGEQNLAAVAARELFEETGIRTSDEDMIRLPDLDTSRGHVKAAIFKVYLSREPKIDLSWEHDLYAWVPMASFAHLASNSNRSATYYTTFRTMLHFDLL